MNAREGALQVLYQVHTQEAYSNLALNQELKKKGYTPQDKAFMTELVYGVLENRLYLDHVVGQLSTTKLEKIHSMTLELLRLGAYQILFLDRVPVSAAVNESVNLAKKYAKRSAGFVNGILRNLDRKRQEIRLPDPESAPAHYLSVLYSHPKWLVAHFLKDHDFDFTEELLAANNQAPPLFLRVNTLKATTEQCLTALREAGVSAQPVSFLEEGLQVKGITNLDQLPLLTEGKVYIQDLASMLIGPVADPKPGDWAVDVCSAPGGKATHLAQLMENKGKVIARDVHPHKIKLIAENRARLGVSILETQLFDATETDPALAGKAACVLVDAPCSGLGIIRRKPEIKYRMKPADLTALVQLQQVILRQAAPYVKPGGTLVYSTCTLNLAENEKQVTLFLQEHPAFKLVNLGDTWGRRLPNGPSTPTLTLYPHRQGTDGFFIAKMIREN